MTDPAVRAAMQEISELLREETGRRLSDDGSTRLERCLARLRGLDTDGGHDAAFTTREVAVLLTDLRGFTSISESFPAGTVLKSLNTYLTRMSEIVIEHQGTIDKFMGDSVMALFGAPMTREDDVRRAVTCAVDMQIAMVEINEFHQELGMPELFMGIGLHTGQVMAGRIGSGLHSDYTVIGDDVNLASRIEAFSLRGQILISETTYERCKDFVTVGEPNEIFVKGKTKQIVVREVLGIPSLDKEIPRLEVRRSPRVRVRMPFRYQVIDGKVVSPEVHAGTIVDIGYHGILASVDGELAPHSEIKLRMDLSLVDEVVTDVYARILKVSEADDHFEVGLEFTSVSVTSSLNIKRFVQMLMQGIESA